MTHLTIDDPAYFERLARAEREHWWHASMWRIASGWLDVALRGQWGLTALDVGCGSGGCLRRLASRADIGRVVGIEPSAHALSLTGSCGVVLGSALALPFRTNSIRLVTCFDVLQHLPRGGDLVAMREIERVLQPGGVAVIRSNGAGLWPDATRGDQPYRLATLIELARLAGFRVLRSSYVNAIPALGTEIIGRIATRFPKTLLRASGMPRFTHGESTRRHHPHGHPQARGLQIRTPNRLGGGVMKVIAAVEAMAVTRLRMNLPVGHSTMMLVEAVGGPNS